FAEKTATEMRNHPSTVQNRVKIGVVLEPFAEEIYGTPLENQERELLRLSRQRSEQICSILEMIALGEAKNVSEAISLLERKPEARLEAASAGDEHKVSDQGKILSVVRMVKAPIPALENEKSPIRDDAEKRNDNVFEVTIDPATVQRFDSWESRNGQTIRIED